MRRLILGTAALFVLNACGDSKKNGNFELKGTFKDSKGEMIYLEKLMNPQPVVVDSTSLDEQGNFEFANYTPKIGFYRIKTNTQNFAMLVLDSADKINVTGSIKDLGHTYKVTGSSETTLFMEYAKISELNKSQIDSLNIAFQTVMQSLKMDSLKMDSLSKIFQPPYEAIMAKANALMAVKIKDNTSMYSSIMAIQGLEPDKYADIYKSLAEGLQKKFPKDKTVRVFNETVNKVLATTDGQEAPEISLPSPEGKEIALSSFRGKIVLIDFWASWCGPCRKDMPGVVNLYKKYKDKGFEIYGVSLDQDKPHWVEAIAKDGITWPQVSDLKYWDCEPAKMYGVQGIPYTVLVDKEGKILTKGLRGVELEKAIENALAGKPVKGNGSGGQSSEVVH
jgi:peroxiredoxin